MKNSILEVVHDTAKGLYDANLMDAKTMHTFDAMCLPPEITMNFIIFNCRHYEER